VEQWLGVLRMLRVCRGAVARCALIKLSPCSHKSSFFTVHFNIIFTHIHK